MSRIKAEQTIDTRGTFSPYPEKEMLEALKAIAPGKVLEVLGDDSVARTTTLSLCNKLGCFYQISDEGKGQWRLLIYKTASDPVASRRGQATTETI